MKCPTKEDIYEQKNTYKHKYEAFLHELNNTVVELMRCANELNCMIDMKNADLESSISATDENPPDYFDAQTVHEAGIQIEKSRKAIEKCTGITATWSNA